MGLRKNSGGTGNNIKSFGKGANIEKGSDPRPRERGQQSNEKFDLNIKDFNKNKSTACGVGKYS